MSQLNRPHTPEPSFSPPGPLGESGMPLAYELGGDLPCIRCRYNLRGLSIREVCPECGLPLRATLLAVVDPLADEFKPLLHPVRTAVGMVVWSFAALAACIAAWVVRCADLYPVLNNYVGDAAAFRWAVPLLTLASAVGAVSMLRPHGGVSLRGVRAAAMGVVMYVPLVGLLAYTMLWDSGAAQAARLSQAPGGLAAIMGLATCALLIAILVLLRPNARMLAARSRLMRSGRADRQTMYTVAAVLCVCLMGYLCGIIANQGQHALMDLLRSIGGLLLLVGWSLFLVGLIGIAHDCWLLYPVIAQPPLSMTDLLSKDRQSQSPRPSRLWSQKP